MKCSVMFSVVVPPGRGSAGYIRGVSELRKFAGLIEDLRYHGIHIIGAPFPGGRSGSGQSPLMLLAQVSGLTKRVRLVTDVLVSTLFAPVQPLEDFRVAQQVLSEGRFAYGTSPGYLSEEEFAGRGVLYADRFKLQKGSSISSSAPGPVRTISATRVSSSGFRMLRIGAAPGAEEVADLVRRTQAPNSWSAPGMRRVCRWSQSSAPQHRRTEEDHFARYIELCKRIGSGPEERPIIHETLVFDTLAEAERLADSAPMRLFGLPAPRIGRKVGTSVAHRRR